MKLCSKYQGVIEYKEEDVITFPKGLPGFRDLKKYILFSVEENNTFNMLHSIENLEIGLLVISPFLISKDYEFNIEDNPLEDLRIENEADVLVLNTVCLNNDIKKATVNLKAPIIINNKEKIGEQLILDDEKYLIKQPLLKEE
jgi:flagellar assembly factor FliW